MSRMADSSQEYSPFAMPSPHGDYLPSSPPDLNVVGLFYGEHHREGGAGITMRVSARNPHRYLLDLADIRRNAESPLIQRYREPLRELAHWAREFLCNPHPQLGRDGLVCPYTKPAMERRTFWMTVCPGDNPALEDVCGLVMEYRDWFRELEPRSGRDAQFKTILIAFPDLRAEDAPRIIEGAQARLKPSFVSEGLMVGQFHATCAEPGLWNEDFRPLRTPVPLLAIRHMVPSDFPFLRREPHLLRAYLRFMGANVPPKLRDAVEAAANGFGLGCPVHVSERS
ncbi:MAG: DUF6875 domain-containing protein [Ktedonobacterales bacterium]